jgi:hypothetical protein
MGNIPGLKIIVPVSSMAMLLRLVVSRTVPVVYVLSRRIVPPLLQVANAALMAGPSSDVPPATSQVAALATRIARPNKQWYDGF